MPSTPPTFNTSPSPKSITPSSSSSAGPSLSSTPRTSSPLNPGSTPTTSAPIALPEEDGNREDFPDFPGRVRGAAMSSRGKKALQPSSPIVKIISTSSPTSTVTPLPGRQEGRLSSLFQRSRSKSPSGRINDNVWRKKVNDADTPPGQGQEASPSASWWGEPTGHAKSWDDSPKKRKNMTKEEEQAWAHTKERVSLAIHSILGTTLEIAHETLELSSDILELAPIPGLSAVARTLLQIWDAVENVDLNTQSCLRLTERCAETLIAVIQEVHDAGLSVTQDLQQPLNKLEEAFDGVRRLLVKEASRPWLKRYLKREEILRDIAGCDADVRAALDMFNLSVSIRILRQARESERRRQAETQAILTAMQSSGNALMLTGMTQEVTMSPPQSPSFAAFKDPVTPSASTSQVSAEQLRAAIVSLQSAQNNTDYTQDANNLRELMRLALQTTSDADVLDLLQIKRQDMPEAIKTLQRALERVVERHSEPESPAVAIKTPPLLKKFSTKGGEGATPVPQKMPTLDSISSSIQSVGTAGKKDTLEREFLESGIEALLRMSQGVETNLPSWTITKYEVDRDQKIGIGFFSDVYKGTWRGRTVAIKVLADTTPRELFRREVTIWKTLKHPHVLELYGASSTSGDPPWFFVSPYEKNGSLNEFLKRIHSQSRSSAASFGSVKSVHHSGGGSPLLSSLGSRIERQATFPIWQGVNSNIFTQPGSKSPIMDTEYRRSRELHRFIYEIAKGMEYLHNKNIYHGDLKAANVLVDNNLHCVISDFGQSEMKSEAFSISGASPPHGTLRWRAPELMRGSSSFTKEMDVYSYAICCVEILSWGSLPWAHVVDDDTVRRLVLDENSRPPLPDSKYTRTPGLQDIVRECWDKKAVKRPSFSQIVPRMKQIKKRAGDLIEDFGSPRIIEVPELEEEVLVRPSPDLRPPPLPFVDFPPPPFSSEQLEAIDDTIDQKPHDETSVPTPGVKFPEPVFFTPTNSRQSSLRATRSSEETEDSNPFTAYHPYSPRSPLLQADIIVQKKNERRYRMILTHDYNPSLVLPLWDPSPVDLGAVGYLAKPRGGFVTLFNACHPNRSSLEAVRALPSIDGYGRVTNGSQRVSKRNNLIDTIMGLLTSKNKGDGVFPQAVSRRYTFPLKAGHRAAFLCAETTEYRYMMSDEGEQLDAPKQWFKANVDTILKIYGAQHQIQREELFLVVGTLRVPNYALFVSHNHPEGHGHFNVFASPKAGQPWGVFTTDTKYDGEGFPGDSPEESSRQSASKVSPHGGSTQWDSVLLARLRFPPDSSGPTTL